LAIRGEIMAKAPLLNHLLILAALSLHIYFGINIVLLLYDLSFNCFLPVTRLNTETK